MFSTILLDSFRESAHAGYNLLRVRPKHSLHAMLGSTGYEFQTATEYSWQGSQGGRARCIFQYTIAGQGNLRVSKTQQILTPGTAMLLTVPGDNHYWLAKGDYWEFFYVSIFGSEVMRAWTTAIERIGNIPALAWESVLVQKAAHIFCLARDGKLNNPFTSSSLAYDMAMELLRIAISPSAHAIHERPASIERAIRFIKENLDKPISLDEMAAAANLSRYHFSRCFRASEGMPPGEYLTNRRLQLAAHLLQTTRDSLEDIALRCGYRDLNYFVRAFRKTMDITPASFRRSGM